MFSFRITHLGTVYSLLDAVAAPVGVFHHLSHHFCPSFLREIKLALG